MPLLAAERQQKIIECLAENDVGRIADFARDFHVTEETIRRDLEKLDRQGKLVRIRGGAIPIAERTRDTPFDIRRGANHAAKERIARQALAHVRDGSVIGLDASSSAHELACRLPDLRITVVTNAFPATAELWNRKQTRVLSTGGLLDPSSRSWIGSFAEQTLQRVNISTLFLSSKGIDVERGLSEVDDAQARVKRRMIELAEHVVLLADHSKFGVRSAVSFAGLGDVQTVITDSLTDQATIDALREMGLSVEIAK
ncbi:MAG: DeoR/GlpR transcriptional regulator [Phycisphaerae bacterium]|nr:DeoR/GlpR transcriptional regulator [Phycisphaerae bacterium]